MNVALCDNTPRGRKPRAWLEAPGVFYGALILLLVVSTGLYVWRFDSFQIGTYADDAEYIVLTESIVRADDYGLVNAPDAILPTRYPWGWPLILAPFYAAFGGRFTWLKAVSLLLTTANTTLIALGWRRLGFSRRWMGLAVAALYALSPETTNHARMVMSEPSLLFFVLVVLILTQALASASKLRLPVAVALGIGWVFVAYVRIIGAAALAASLIVLVRRRKWRAMVVAAVSAAVVVAMIAGSTVIDCRDLVAFDLYRAEFSHTALWEAQDAHVNLIARVCGNLQRYATVLLRDSLVPFVGGPTTARLLGRVHLGGLVPLAAVAVVLLLLIGYAQSVLQPNLLAVDLFVALYWGVLMIWPVRGVRLLYGVVPFLYALLLMGLGALLRRAMEVLRLDARRRNWPDPLSIAVGVLLCSLLARSLMIDDSLDHAPDLSIGSDWIRAHTPADSIVVAEEPVVAYLYSGRHTVGLSDDPGAVAATAKGRPVYLLIAPQLKWSDTGKLEYSARSAAVLARAVGGAWDTELVFENGQALVKVFGMGRQSRVQE